MCVKLMCSAKTILHSRKTTLKLHDSHLRNKMISKSCDRHLLLRRLPILSWLPKYSGRDALSDIIAGITVGLTLMPQAIAYAALAGLSPQYGLYSAFAGSFVYIVLGTCKEVNIGPTALLSLLTFNYTHDTHPDMAVLLCFLSGCIELLCGILHLGFLVEFVSVPVVAGFTSAAAIIIASSQLKGLLGLTFKAEDFIETWIELVNHIGESRTWDIVLGVSCVTVLLALRKLNDIKFGNEKEGSRKYNVLKKILWFLSTGRNAMVVVICASIAYVIGLNGDVPFLMTGKIEPGIPEVSVPPFTTFYDNSTVTFLGMCKHLGSGIAVVPIVAILGNVAIAKAFSTGDMVDATQEMITLGVCNIVGSFFRSMPVNGSFSRSAVNNASGVRTPMGGLYTGAMVLLALSLLTPYFYFIPRATLSSVIICAVIFMVEAKMISTMWKSNKRDLFPACVTFLACLYLGVQKGILVGIAVDIAFLLYFNARPRVQVEKVVTTSGMEYIVVTPSTGLLFPAVDYVREAIGTAARSEESGDKKLPVVVNCRHVQRVDFTASQGTQALIQDLKKRGHYIVFHNVKPEVARILAGVYPSEFLCSSTDTELLHILKGISSDIEDCRAPPRFELQTVRSSFEGIETNVTKF